MLRTYRAEVVPGRLWYADASVLPVGPDYILFTFLVLILSLAVHEAAHAWSADLLGDPTALRLGRLSLNPGAHVDVIGSIAFPLLVLLTHPPAFGWGKRIPVSANQLGSSWRRKYVLILAAGPASNLALALAASALLRAGLAATGTGLDLPIARLLYTGLTINVLLVVFNMLPVPPLDAGTMLAGLLPGRGGALLDRLRPYGFLMLIALLLTGVLSSVLDPVAGAIISRLD